MRSLSNLITLLRYLNLGHQVTLSDTHIPPLEMDFDGTLCFALERTTGDKTEEVWADADLSYNHLLELAAKLTEEELVGMRGTLALSREPRKHAR